MYRICVSDVTDRSDLVRNISRNRAQIMRSADEFFHGSITACLEELEC